MLCDRGSRMSLRRLLIEVPLGHRFLRHPLRATPFQDEVACIKKSAEGRCHRASHEAHSETLD